MKKYFLKLLYFLFFLYTINPSMAFTCDEWYTLLKKGLADYHPEKIPENKNSGKFYEWKLQAKVREDNFFENAGDAILNLYRAGHSDTLELIWWTSRKPETRLLILSLMYCRVMENTSVIPYFDPCRFELEEAKERKLEFDYIERNRKKIHILLKRYNLLYSGDSFEINK